MTRNTEAALLGVATAVAAFGVALASIALGEDFLRPTGLTVLMFGSAFATIHLALRRWAPLANTLVLPLVAILAAVGIIEVHRIDPQLGADQRVWLVLAAVAGSAVLATLNGPGLVVLRRYRYLFLLGALFLLALPLLPSHWPAGGAEINGSRLWFRVQTGSDFVQFQPGEGAKLLLVAFLASYLADNHRSLATMTRQVGPLRLPEPRQLVPLLAAFGISFAVLVYQRDLGLSLLLFGVFAAMLYAATARLAYVAGGGLLVAAGGFLAFQAFDHVQRRVSSWLNPFDDFTGVGYQVAQSLFALGSGSLTGSGIGAGDPGLIPAAATDYVFVAVAEEMGLAGSLAVIAGFAMLVAVGLGIALRSRDLFRKLLAAGLAMTLAIQTILILGGVLRLLPITGITLPFMSYGGSSLVANMMLVATICLVSHEERA